MRKVFIFLGALTMAFAVSCSKNEIIENSSVETPGNNTPEVSQPISPETAEKAMFYQGRAIVKFSDEIVASIEKGLATKAVSSMPEELGLKVIERVFPDAGEFEERTRREGLHRFYFVEFDKALTYESASTLIAQMDGVENVEPCRKAKIAAFDDPYLSRLWGFTGTYNINIQDAWEYSTGNPNVVVCVVDEGIQQDHPDLKWNLYSDNYNFVKRSTTINAGDHGTHVSGTIAGVSNNGVGVAGIAGGNYKENQRGVSLQSAQVFDGESSASSFANAIKWGADHGAVISQNSWGYNYDWNDDGQITGQELEAALAATTPASDAAAIDYFNKYAGCDNAGNQRADSPMKGGVVVFAAGNDGIANGIPGNYEGVIGVGAVASTGYVASFSNYGDWVDICAPGQNIYSTKTGGVYGSLSGTSMACPHVSGACALLVSVFGGEGFTNEMLRDIVINGANPSRVKDNGHKSGPYLDVMGSITYGLETYRRANNNDPEITTDYEGDFVFRQYQNISIPFHIVDPDGDALKVTTQFEGRGDLEQDQDNPDIWYFKLTGELVNNFSPMKAVITAKDVYGGECKYEFTYQVIKNNAPKAVGSIDDMIIVGTGSTKTINLSKLFTDADGETLKITAKDLVDAPAKLSVADGVLTLTTTSYGSSTITVSAVDGLKEKATIKFKYLVRSADVEMDFYPNPVRDYLHVRTGINTENTEIVIETSTGNEVYHETKSCSAFEPVQVNMKDYAPGMYVLRVTVGGKTYVNNVTKR